MLPHPVVTLHDTLPLIRGSVTKACRYDQDTSTLHITLQKAEAGQEFPGLDTLTPQLLSEEERAQFEKDAMQEVKHAYGLLDVRTPLPLEYQALLKTGRVPYLDVVDPTLMSDRERACEALKHESDKWDEGMYLDAYVDMDGEIAHAVSVRPSILRRDVPAVASKGDLPEPSLAPALLVQVLFAYLYEAHVSMDDPSPESAWTLIKLSRSLSCFASPMAPGESLHDVLIGCYRRALTYPLYRSWTLCERVRSEMVTLLQGDDAPARVVAALQDIDKMLALAPTGTGLVEQTELVLQLVWDLWIQPLQTWAHAQTTLTAVAQALTAPSKDAVGTPGDWDLALLEVAAREAMEQGEGGFV